MNVEDGQKNKKGLFKFLFLLIAYSLEVLSTRDSVIWYSIYSVLWIRSMGPARDLPHSFKYFLSLESKKKTFDKHIQVSNQLSLPKRSNIYSKIIEQFLGIYILVAMATGKILFCQREAILFDYQAMLSWQDTVVLWSNSSCIRLEG